MEWRKRKKIKREAEEVSKKRLLTFRNISIRPCT